MFIGIFSVPNTIRICKTVQETFSKNSWDYPFLVRKGGGGAGAAAGGEREGEGEIGEAHAQEPPEETNYLWAHCDIFQIKNLLFPDKIMLISKKTYERKKKNTAINQFGFAHFTFFLSCHHTLPHPIKFWMK